MQANYYRDLCDFFITLSLEECKQLRKLKTITGTIIYEIPDEAGNTCIPLTISLVSEKPFVLAERVRNDRHYKYICDSDSFLLLERENEIELKIIDTKDVLKVALSPKGLEERYGTMGKIKVQSV